MVNCILLSSGEPENLWGEALLLPVLYSIGFLKETPTLLHISIGKGELLTFIFLKFGLSGKCFNIGTKEKENWSHDC